MSQAFHGGGVRQAAKRFGLPLESIVDFSSADLRPKSCFYGALFGPENL